MLQKTASFKQLILDVLFTPVKSSVFMVVVAVAGMYTLGLNQQADQEIGLYSQNPVSLNMNRQPKVLGAETSEDGNNNFSLIIDISKSTQFISKTSNYSLRVNGVKQILSFDFLGLGNDTVDLTLQNVPAKIAIIKQDYLLMVFVNGLWQKSTHIEKPEYNINFENLPKEAKFIPRALGAPELLN